MFQGWMVLRWWNDHDFGLERRIAHSPLTTHHSLLFSFPFLPPCHNIPQTSPTSYHQLIKTGSSFLPRDLHFFPSGLKPQKQGLKPGIWNPEPETCNFFPHFLPPASISVQFLHFFPPVLRPWNAISLFSHQPKKVFWWQKWAELVGFWAKRRVKIDPAGLIHSLLTVIHINSHSCAHLFRKT